MKRKEAGIIYTLGQTVLMPSPLRTLQFLTLCGATFGFFKFFRIEGLDGLMLSLREQGQVEVGNRLGLGYAPATGNSSQFPAPFPSTALPAQGYAPTGSGSMGNQFDRRTLPYSTHDQPGITQPQADLWAFQASPARVQNANYSKADLSTDLRHRVAKIRFGTLNLAGLNMEKLKDPFIGDRLAQIVMDFGGLALQSIDTSNPNLLPTLISIVNANGRRYEYLEGNKYADNAANGLAILFDADQLEVDRYQSYTLRDGTNTLSCEPLVAWFRVVQASPQEAFTLSFVNINLTGVEAIRETQLLPDILSSIQQDGRNEDDVILAGSIAPEPDTLETLKRQACKILPTQPVIDAQRRVLQTIITSSTCREYTGESGDFQILRRYNLTPQEANSISPFPIVWADFHLEESTIY